MFEIASKAVKAQEMAVIKDYVFTAQVELAIENVSPSNKYDASIEDIQNNLSMQIMKANFPNSMTLTNIDLNTQDGKFTGSLYVTVNDTANTYKVIFSENKFTVEEDKNIEEITYTVTFNANGGESSITTKKIAQNNTYGTLPQPTKENYRFLGWYTDIENGNKIVETDIVTENITLYARWEEAPDLIAWYDGIDNTNDGHSYEATTWTDLTGNNTTGATINGATWTEDGLLFDGNDYVNINTILMPEEDNFAIDVVFSLNNYTSDPYIFGQNISSLPTSRLGLHLGRLGHKLV